MNQPFPPGGQIRIRKPSRNHIDVRNPDDVTMWCRRLGLTPLQLCSLVERVGNDALDLQHAMRGK